MDIATLIASNHLSRADVDGARDALAGVGAMTAEPAWIDDGIAVDLPFGRIDRAAARAALEGLLPGVDVVVQPRAHRAKKLLVADMDSTMITIECIDELADYAGIKAEIAAVTERAMRGELDFEAALDARVALLKDLDESAIERCHAERVVLMGGARTLIQTMKANGARTVLVSGGFTVFADRVAASIGFDRALSNRLGLADGRLTGIVARPIVGAATKQAVLEEERAALGLDPAETLAVGDGANDIPMIQAAGLGVAYHAKPRTAAAAAARIAHGDLTALLYAQGYARAAWVD
ncbi:phosphoserine phosphatase SerB [Sphingomonas nostoxanthinifaciens]|uniref:phosphoserine phosphatase SerB n=1 Tax=Sphingomonas nostoxanthinifaciens TaxID=2872652 RepID=UPI001CC1E7BC|nr:phosphoserine phosphatase SerB [Sphingomonas nostoxanthinifaciens]UAK24845.1 phosphoserine phosphatase SerB [Sphingomonas nostoxanthinifaciens]